MSELKTAQATATGLNVAPGVFPLPVFDAQPQPDDPPADPYPRHYAVNDRPVKLVRLPDGSVDALVFDWSSGAFVADRTYFARVSDTGVGKDVDQFSEADFLRLVGELRRPIAARLVASEVVWEATGDGEYPYAASLDQRQYRIRANDFPAEPLYTLLVGAEELADLEDWPAAWIKS